MEQERLVPSYWLVVFFVLLGRVKSMLNGTNPLTLGRELMSFDSPKLNDILPPKNKQ